MRRVSMAAHSLPAARLRATLHAPVSGTHGIKIFPFGLLRSGQAKKFPTATGVVTINGGNPVRQPHAPAGWCVRLQFGSQLGDWRLSSGNLCW